MPPPTAGAGSRLRAALLLVGLTSVIGQIVLLRELLIASLGNELSLGLTLTIWLLWTAVGSSLLGRLGRHADPRRTLGLLQTAAAFALPVAIYLARASRNLLGLAPGEPLSPLAIVVTAAVTLSVFCPITGWLFAAGTRAWQSTFRTGIVASCTSMYLFEAAGSALGGVLASVVLLRTANATQIAVALGAVNLLSATWIALRQRRSQLALSAALVMACAAGLAFSPRVDVRTASAAWRGFRTIGMRNSPYGSIAVIEQEGSRSVLQNGVVLFTAPDPATAEESVHFAMLEHAAPQRVLLIGGGFNGSLSEILKYTTVTSVDYVEPDPALLAVARDYFPQQWAQLGTDRRLHLHATDGRLYGKWSQGRYDVIIVALPEPQTAQLNRFYTEEFFREAAAKLDPGGVFAFSVHGAEEYLSPQRTEFLRCLQATLAGTFSATATVPGETVHFLATNERGALTLDPQELVQRLRIRGIATSYISEYYLPYRMMPERVSGLREQIQPTPETRVNRDFTPLAYYFGVALWSTQFAAASRWTFALARQVPFGLIVGATLALSLLVAVWYGRSRNCAGAGAGFAVACTGLTLMAVEILLLLGFQALYGYVFDELAVIVAAFMAGLGLGACFRMPKTDGPTGAGLRQLLFLQIAMLAAPLVSAAVLMGSASFQPLALRLVAHVGVPALALVCGIAGGMQFSLATRIWLASEQGSAGALYALDLLGAAAGAAFISIYLLPVFGFAQTAALLAIANTGPALLLMLALRRASGLAQAAAT